jgi:hypothetical protein
MSYAAKKLFKKNCSTLKIYNITNKFFAGKGKIASNSFDDFLKRLALFYRSGDMCILRGINHVAMPDNCGLPFPFTSKLNNELFGTQIRIGQNYNKNITS